MHEILKGLPSGAYVLDLGSYEGSFDVTAYALFTVKVDLQAPSEHAPGIFVQADASSLPFGRDTFDAVISNHSLEHFTDLNKALQELGRICKKESALYVAVPDCTTLTDILYRWLAASGGGHVNRFSCVEDLASMIEQSTGLPHLGTRPLCTSLSFLNCKNRKARPPRKLLLLGGGRESVLLILNWLFRLSDRFLSTRFSLYGWALYFGREMGPIDSRPWMNVCIRCGAGHPSNWLLSINSVRRRHLVRSYDCPSCSAANVFFEDQAYSGLE